MYIYLYICVCMTKEMKKKKKRNEAIALVAYTWKNMKINNSRYFHHTNKGIHIDKGWVGKRKTQ
jgi:hypothetical protein